MRACVRACISSSRASRAGRIGRSVVLIYCNVDGQMLISSTDRIIIPLKLLTYVRDGERIVESAEFTRDFYKVNDVSVD